VSAALADADGEPAIRRVVQAAWSGGALPIIVVADDPEGRLAAGISGLPATLTQPGPAEPPGVTWFANGLRAAALAVTESTAGLLWPFRYVWVDPETVTSLVEAHGTGPAEIIRPAWLGQVGFPILTPMELTDSLAALAPVHGREAVESLVAQGAAYRVLELGDPGIVHDAATPRSALPGYQGPPQPPAAGTSSTGSGE
jgi:CTP:molybdopterin cytidylyltransferase MocA